ncbi:MAG: BtrH N-terminal domain-containing protein [Chloroflexota bacterium]
MAPSLLPGFRPLPTHHCITGSLRHIYEYNGFPVSEELLLGLGAGLGFVYFHFKGQPPFLGGRANTGRPGEEGMERAAGRRTGVKVETFRTGSARKAETAMLELLRAGRPAMLQLDMGYLPYLELPEEYHFGGHAVVVCGYDPAASEVLVADRDGVPHPLTLAQLALARGSKHKPFAPEHMWYTFDFAKQRPPAAAEVWAAIAEALHGLLQPPIANLGVKGIAKAAQAIVAWPGAMTDEELRFACFNTFIFIDATGGTGGGCFRYMYGRFLAEAATLVGEPQLAALGEELRQVGDRWQETALLLREASQTAAPRPPLAAAGAVLRDVADREDSLWRRLAQVVDEKG